MKYFLRMVIVIFVLTGSINVTWGQDADLSIPKSNIEIPQNIKILLDQIRTAENNEDWQLYYALREQIINKLQKTSPDISQLYNTVNVESKANSNFDGEGVPLYDINIKPKENTPSTSPLWENDVVFYENRVLNDFSMDVSFDGNIFVSIATNNGTSLNDSLFIYKSSDGGLTWNLWVTRTTSGDYNKTEIMCFDSFSGTGENYVLLFYTFSSTTTTPRLNVARYLMSDPSTLTTTSIVTSDVVDFAVDRNYPATGYRAIVLYDSLNAMMSVRSDPASYGTIWQDKYSIGHVGKDVDLCYGLNGSTYISYNGYNSGNLYVRENLNYGDPLSWSDYTTLALGTTDTTQHSEIIASRADQTSIKVQVLYAKQNGSTFDLKLASKVGSGAWTSDQSFIANGTWNIIYPSLYCSKVNDNSVFQCSYTMSESVSPFTRQINQRIYNGTSWQGSQTISDYTPTGLQKSYVAELNGEPIVLYTGSNGYSLYFDNNGWLPPVPVINIDPTSLDFGQVNVNSSSALTFNIENTGTADLQVSNITSDNAAFTVNLTSTTITPGNNLDIEVTFLPTNSTNYNGIITITHNASGGPSQVSVSGEGAAPAVTVNPSSLDFGLVTVNEDSMMTFNIANTGNADLEITNITSDNTAFTINLTNTTITPGNNQDIEVTFSPAAVTTYNGTIEITHNAAGSSSSIGVTGQGSPAVGLENELFSQIPSDYGLFQNYPNPFNPATSIVFGIPEPNEVKLTLYSFLGEEIKVLFQGYKTAGYYKVEFNASDLPSGIYFYRIQTGNFVSTKKMILLK